MTGKMETTTLHQPLKVPADLVDRATLDHYINLVEAHRTAKAEASRIGKLVTAAEKDLKAAIKDGRAVDPALFLGYITEESVIKFDWKMAMILKWGPDVAQDIYNTMRDLYDANGRETKAKDVLVFDLAENVEAPTKDDAVAGAGS